MTDKVGFKDLGAGGVACASVELADAAGMGAEVWADEIHTSASGLPSHIVLCSETQERFMWVCNPKVTPTILDHYNKKFDLPNVSLRAQAKIVGKIIKEPRYTVYANKKKIVDGPIKTINEGFVYKRPFLFSTAGGLGGTGTAFFGGTGGTGTLKTEKNKTNEDDEY